MIAVIGIGRGDAGEQVLEILAGQKIAVAQRVLAEFGQKRVAAVVGDDRIGLGIDGLARPWRGDEVVGRNIASSGEIHRASPLAFRFSGTVAKTRMFF